MARKAIALTLIVGSLIFAVLIFVNGKLPNEATLTDSTVSKTETLPNSLSNVTPQVPSASSGQVNNSTREVVKDIVQEIAKLNTGDLPSSGENKINVPQPEKLVNKLITEKLSGFDYSVFSPEIESSDLKIIKSPDKNSMENYLKNFNAILVNNFSSKKDVLDDPLPENFKTLATAYGKTINQFYSLNVPENFVSAHTEGIKILTAQKTAFEALANYQNDPFKAMVAVQVIEKSYDQLANLSQMIFSLQKTNHLSI